MPLPASILSRLHPSDLAQLRSELRGSMGGFDGSPTRPGQDAPHHERAKAGGYGRVPASALLNVAVVGAYNNGAGGFTIPCEVKDAMLYLNDDAGAVADILSVACNGQVVTLNGSLPASTMRDDASLGGPVKGFYLGDVSTSTPLVITGTTKLANAVFSFYLLGRYQNTNGRDIGIAEARGPNPR